jgi:hypothetical protein
MRVWMCVVHGILHEGEEYNLDDSKETGLVTFLTVSDIHISDDVQLPLRFGKQKATHH